MSEQPGSTLYAEDLVLRHFEWAIESNIADQKRQTGVIINLPSRPNDVVGDHDTPLATTVSGKAALNGAPHLRTVLEDRLLDPQATAASVQQSGDSDSLRNGGGHKASAAVHLQNGAAPDKTLADEDLGGRQFSGMMQTSVDRMFQTGGPPGPEEMSPRAAAAAAREKGTEMGDEMLSELLMAWYYAGYSTGRMTGRTEP